MQKRRLGNSNLEASAIGLGCMGMSQSYGTAEERDEHGAQGRATARQARHEPVRERKRDRAEGKKSDQPNHGPAERASDHRVSPRASRRPPGWRTISAMRITAPSR